MTEHRMSQEASDFVSLELGRSSKATYDDADDGDSDHTKK